MWSHYADGLRGFCIGFDEDALTRDPEMGYLAAVEYLDTPPVVDSFLYVVAEDQLDYFRMAIHDRSRNEAYFGPDPVADEDYQRVADESLELMTTIWQRAFAAKPRQWEYEDEYRLLIRTDEEGGAPVLRGYPADAVMEIIIGERMVPNHRKRLIEVCRKTFPSASLLIARRLRDRFTLKIEPLDK